MSVIKKPDLTDPKLRAKLAKGMGHNYYGEPAWPNDLLYVFPVCILGTFACCLLYTSDAADDTPCVDLGGRRIIKKCVNIKAAAANGKTKVCAL